MPSCLEREIRQLKDNTPCADCGQKYPWWVMEFDHITGNKVANVSELVKRNNRQLVLEEIDKCELVCSNCHATRTHFRHGGILD